MKKCFICRNIFSNTNELCDHLKNYHNLCGKGLFECMQCGFTFGDLTAFKNHLNICKREPFDQEDAESDGWFILMYRIIM